MCYLLSLSPPPPLLAVPLTPLFLHLAGVNHQIRTHLHSHSSLLSSLLSLSIFFFTVSLLSLSFFLSLALCHSLICFLVHLANMSCGKTTDKYWEKCVGECVCVCCVGAAVHICMCAVPADDKGNCASSSTKSHLKVFSYELLVLYRH